MFGLCLRKTLEEEKIRAQMIREENKILKDALDKERAKNRGERITGPYCEHCNSGYSYSEFCVGVGYLKRYGCMLDCKCKDFSLKHETDTNNFVV